MSAQRVLLQLLVEADPQTVAAVAQRAREKLSRSGKVARPTIQRFWKTPGYFEVSLDLNLTRDLSSFDNLLATFGAGWVCGDADGQSHALWNPGPGRTFFDRAVRWASVTAAGPRPARPPSRAPA